MKISILAILITLAVWSTIECGGPVKRKIGLGKKSENTKTYLNGIWSRIGKRSRTENEHSDQAIESSIQQSDQEIEILRNHIIEAILSALNQIEFGENSIN